MKQNNQITKLMEGKIESLNITNSKEGMKRGRN